MSESTLSLNFDALQKELAYFIGKGRDSTLWTTAEKELIQAIMDSGIRQFLFPPAIDGEVYQWTFLTPTTSMVAWNDVAVGTNTVTGVYAEPLTTLTAVSDAFYSNMTSKSVVITDIGTFAVASYTSSKVIVVTGDATCSGKTFSISGDGTYDMPDACGGVEGLFTFAPTEGYTPIKIIGEGQIRALKQDNTSTSKPVWVCLRMKTSTGATGQRWEAVFFPPPDDNYTLSYRSILLPDALATTKYPLGGMPHSETVLESCLSIAEQRKNDTVGIHYQKFLERLKASIEFDKSRGAEFLGYNGNVSDVEDDRGVYFRSNHVSYNGVIYET